MTYLNPLIAPLAGGPQAQRTAADKERQIARAQALGKNSAAEGDRFEHTVGSADAVSPVGDDPARGGSQNKQQHKDPKTQDEAGDDTGGESRLDVTA